MAFCVCIIFSSCCFFFGLFHIVSTLWPCLCGSIYIFICMVTNDDTGFILDTVYRHTVLLGSCVLVTVFFT